jgi:adenylate kinase
MPLDLLLLGAPGAGKGTQAKRIAEDYEIPQIATGDMLRAAVAAGTELGRRVKPILDAGELVPDDLIVALIRERLSEADTGKGFILDGFPRTIPQAEALDAMLEEVGREIAVVLEFQLSEEEAARRMLGRADEHGRSDDTPETIRRRLDVYREQTEPLAAYYLGRGMLVGIDAGRSIDDVHAQIADVLEQVLERQARS